MPGYMPVMLTLQPTYPWLKTQCACNRCGRACAYKLNYSGEQVYACVCLKSGERTGQVPV